MYQTLLEMQQPVTSSSFAVDTSVPSISAITTDAFSWGAVLNAIEDNSDGTVYISTVGVEDGQPVTITLNGITYTSNILSNATTVTISAARLQGLSNGQSYTMIANVSDAAGNAAHQVTSSSFAVDTSVPSINAITTDAFSWGAVLNTIEDNSNGTVTVTTLGVEDGRPLTITLNDISYTATVNNNATTVTISAAGLQGLTNGQSYTMIANVSDAAGNPATPVTSSSFAVDTSVPSISAITTDAFSWGAVLNTIEDNSDGTVTVTTVGVEDGLPLTITLNGITYTSNILSNSTTVTIPAAGLQGLTNGQSYTIIANVSDAAGNAATQLQVHLLQ